MANQTSVHHQATQDLRRSGQVEISRASLSWIPWLVGIALVAAITVAAFHFGEAKAIANIAHQAAPAWLAIAAAIQLFTYAAQAEIWRAIGTAANFRIPFITLFRLSLAKLFLDQAIPSAGVSGTAAVATHLERMGMSLPVVMATTVLNISSYFLSYVVLLIPAVLIIPIDSLSNRILATSIIVFAFVSLAIAIAITIIPGHKRKVLASSRWTFLRALGNAFSQANQELVRSPGLITWTTVCQCAIVILDAATIWALLKALGSSASPAGVFASFVISNVFRTLGVLPGGLGTFEASAIWTLQMAGASLPAAASATLLFRGLSFWLPMLPGAWCSRDLVRKEKRLVVCPQVAELRARD
jgi:uncharacterized protein (TIRG00374 family)